MVRSNGSLDLVFATRDSFPLTLSSLRGYLTKYDASSADVTNSPFFNPNPNN